MAYFKLMPDHFESQSSLKLSLTSARCLRFDFIGCGSFLEWNYPDILALHETNLE